MINCLATRRELLADPATHNVDVSQHLASCPHCMAFGAKVSAEEVLLRGAIDVRVPEQLQERILLQTQLQRRTHGWLSSFGQRIANFSFPARAGISAVLSVAAAVMIGMWYPASTNIHSFNWGEVALAHVIAEPAAVASMATVPRAALSDALAGYNLALAGDIGAIRYVEHCAVPGGRGMHIVVDTRELGKVTLILPPAGMATGAGTAAGEGYVAQMMQIAGVSVGVVMKERQKLVAATALLNSTIVVKS